ncbi:hypothetical protein LEP1GSC125_0122 [Leptospira mayottensis 200901122]|uniref:Insertion element IS402-like domain-containing protein n=1 Tax=Leptospira mayottensis 200901122 TaxID=1193010 RepID=A0AA87MNE7_9LEPT|nr:hypothetical protein LEP1GSC125_0122 [Leptospira mayottensis 200901122]
MTTIFYRVRTGVQWRYPPMFGLESTLYRRFQEWGNSRSF